MRPGQWIGTLLAALLALSPGLAPPAHAKGTLRYGLEFDPDVLDNARNGSYTDRIVFTWMCDQLIDIDAHLNYVPMLATHWAWSADHLALTLTLRQGVTFQDGTPFDATAMKINLERYAHATYSLRKGELAPVVGVDVLGPLSLRIRLSHPYAPLLAVLANRSGTPMSPRSLTGSPDAIAAHPVCAGPFSFANRVAQDHITLNRYPGYWNAKAIHFDRVVFPIITDPSVRLVNLQSGHLDIVNRLAATDVKAVRADRKLRVVTSPSLGFQLITFNIAHGPAANTPLGRDWRVRAAFEKSIDRRVLNQVVFNGLYVPSNQTEAPGTRYWNPRYPVPPRDLAGARKLLREAGVKRVPFTLIVGNDPVNGQIAQVLQSMSAPAGFDMKISQRESAALVAATKTGYYQATMVIWSGRPDPDGNAAIWMSCHGFLNWGRYCNKTMDGLLARGAATIDPAKRVPIYRRIEAIAQHDLSHMVLFHFTWLWGVTDRLKGAVPMPDGILRPAGMRFAN